MKFEFIHGDRMLYMTAENEKDRELFRMLAKCEAQILGSNIKTPQQPEKWFAITFPDRGSEAVSEDNARLNDGAK
jgi:hypothetical protein